MTSPKSKSIEVSQSGSSRSDIEGKSEECDDDFVCVPLSNLNKEKNAFNTREQLFKKSLMMSEMSNIGAAGAPSEMKVLQSMVMYAHKDSNMGS